MATRKSRGVSFDSSGVIIIPPGEPQTMRFKDELRSSWYTREELMESCYEAKKIVKIINAVNGNFHAIDHSQICIVGLEKFHGKKEREKYRKLLIRSVLIRQEMNRGLGIGQDTNCLCEISEMISSSFKEFALWQAAMHKFHANEAHDSQNQDQNGREGRYEPPGKRQRRTSQYEHPATVSAQVQDNPTKFREEVHQLMAGFCAR